VVLVQVSKPYYNQGWWFKNKKLLGPMDFIISGWECQGFSTYGLGEGLNETRSNLFTDMV
jgi:site-specific DNA-cytosine methylase